MTSINPDSWIQGSVETLAETLSSKNSDYAPEGEFSNFEQAADFAGVTTFDVMMSQLGIKVTRIKALLEHGQAENESLSDSLLDLAGYAIIAHAHMSANNHTIEPEPGWDRRGPNASRSHLTALPDRDTNLPGF